MWKNTPKKVCLGRKPIPENPNDYCRCCKISLKIRYGDSWKSISSENLFLPSQKKGLEGTVLSDALKTTGLLPDRTSDLSDRVCKPCATKIRKTSEGFNFIASVLNEVNPKFVTAINLEVEVTDVVLLPRTKRTLPTSVSTPERSPGQKKVTKTGESPTKDTRKSTARKSLGLQFGGDVRKNEDTLLNIDDMISSEQSTRVKVVVLWPSGKTDVRVPDEKENINLLKNIALKNWNAVANAVMTHSELRQDILRALWRTLNAELKKYCSAESVLKHRNPKELIAFSNGLLVEEVATKCPFWSSCISGACGVNMNEDCDLSAQNAIALATSVTARFRNKSMSALAYRISSILFHSGVSHQDSIRLNRLGVCMSPNMILGLQRSLGQNFDAKVQTYLKALERKPTETLALLDEIKRKQVQEAINVTEDNLKHYNNFSVTAFVEVTKMLEEEKLKRNVDFISVEVLDQVISDHKKFNFPFFKLVGDNIDHEIHARDQSKEHGNKSIHWTHQYAIRDSVVDPLLDNSKPQKSLDQLQLMELLPTPDVQARLKRSWAILVSRVVTRYLGEFCFLQNVVVKHIPHPFAVEASQQSEICCLGMEFFNPNIAGEMAQLLMNNQKNYVPCCGDGESKKVITPIPFHGDQLFEERARNVIGMFQDGDNEFDRLEGLHPEFADWHAKVNLYEMEYEMFYKSDSGGELGTTKASMNRSRKTNASGGPKAKYNEYKDFHQCEVEGHICAAFLEMSGMANANDRPNYILPDDSVTKTTKGKWLLELCESFIDKYVFASGDINSLVQQTQELELATLGHYNCRVEGCDKAFVYHSGRVSHEISAHHIRNNRGGRLQDEFGYYYCRADCGKVYSTTVTRNRHEQRFHPDIELPEEVTEGETKDSSDNDHLFNYHCAKLKFGLILFNFNDAVKEGDGQRLHDIYKLALLLYKAGGHFKYAYVVLLYLVKIAALYSEFEAFQLLWNRFYNKYGLIGQNISLDLKKEQMHKILKTIWRAMGPNLNQASASRVAEALENLEQLLHSIDADCGLDECKGYRSKGNNGEAVLQVMSDLWKSRPLSTHGAGLAILPFQISQAALSTWTTEIFINGCLRKRSFGSPFMNGEID